MKNIIKSLCATVVFAMGAGFFVTALAQSVSSPPYCSYVAYSSMCVSSLNSYVGSDPSDALKFCVENSKYLTKTIGQCTGTSSCQQACQRYINDPKFNKAKYQMCLALHPWYPDKCDYLKAP